MYLLAEGPIDLDGEIAERKEILRDNAIAKLSPEELQAVLELQDRKQ